MLLPRQSDAVALHPVVALADRQLGSISPGRFRPSLGDVAVVLQVIGWDASLVTSTAAAAGPWTPLPSYPAAGLSGANHEARLIDQSPAKGRLGETGLVVSALIMAVFSVTAFVLTALGNLPAARKDAALASQVVVAVVTQVNFAYRYRQMSKRKS